MKITTEESDRAVPFQREETERRCCCGTWSAQKTTYADRVQFQWNFYEEKAKDGGTFLSRQRRTGINARTSERNDPPRMVPDLLRSIGVCRVTSRTRYYSDS